MNRKLEKEKSDMHLFKRKKSVNHKLLKIIGGAALALLAAEMVVSLPDIKRYIKITTM